MLTSLTPGAARTIVYRVSEGNMVQRLLPGVPEFIRKPEVMATGWLVGVCEWPAMDALRDHMTDTQCSLGTRVELSHLAPIPAGMILTVTARCQRVEGAYSEWHVLAVGDREAVASGVVGLVVVDIAQFTLRRLARERPGLEV